MRDKHGEDSRSQEEDLAKLGNISRPQRKEGGFRAGAHPGRDLEVVKGERRPRAGRGSPGRVIQQLTAARLILTGSAGGSKLPENNQARDHFAKHFTSTKTSGRRTSLPAAPLGLRQMSR